MAPEGRRAGRGAGPALNSSACSSGRKRDSPVAVEKPGRGIAPWHIEGLFKKNYDAHFQRRISSRLSQRGRPPVCRLTHATRPSLLSLTVTRLLP